MNRIFALCVALAFLCNQPNTAWAEPTEADRLAEEEESQIKRRIEEEARQSLLASETIPPRDNQRFLFDWGGWTNFRYIDYENDDNDESERDLYDYTYFADVRLWTKLIINPPLNATYENQHSVYIRVKNLFVEDLPEDTAGGYDYDGPHLEYAYTTIDLRPVWIEAGRQYREVGQGLAYSDVHDGLQLWLLYKEWQFKLIAAHTLPNEENIDLSIPGYEKYTDRLFWGAEANYQLNRDHKLYAFLLAEKDYSEEQPNDPEHTYRYDSEYIGIGTQAILPSGIDYWFEAIYETGSSRIFETKEKKPISAWAANTGLAYNLNIYSHPRFETEYAFGSGDSDRDSVTDTEGGNISGKDTNFLYFGYIPTGYALSPRLSNIHIYRIGASCNPFERYVFFKRLELSVNYYRFWKNKASGAIYDLEATADSHDIGYEIDFELSWQILSDLRFITQYGRFYPGGAYSSAADDKDEYLSLSMTLTF